MADKDYALIFALNKYKDSTQWRPLKGAVNDADRFKKWLLGTAQVPLKNIIYEVGENGEEPTLSDLMSKVWGLLRRGRSGTRIGRRLYIFLAGHGVEAIDQARIETLLVTAESEQNWVQGFPGSIAMSHFRIEARFEEIVLFMDCCRTMNSDARPTWNIPPKPDAAAKNVRWGSALASEIFTEARERCVNGKMQGIFTNALMEGLEGKAENGDGAVTTESLSAYLYGQLKGDHRPDIHFTHSIVFVASQGDGGNHATVTLPDLAAGSSIVVRDGLDITKVIPVQPQPRAEGGLFVELPAFGTYLVELLDANGSVQRQEPVILETENVHVSFH